MARATHCGALAWEFLPGFKPWSNRMATPSYLDAVKALFPVALVKEKERAIADGRNPERITGLFIKRPEHLTGVAWTDVHAVACAQSGTACPPGEGLKLAENAGLVTQAVVWCRGKQRSFPQTLVKWVAGQHNPSTLNDSMARLGLSAPVASAPAPVATPAPVKVRKARKSRAPKSRR